MARRRNSRTSQRPLSQRRLQAARSHYRSLISLRLPPDAPTERPWNKPRLHFYPLMVLDSEIEIRCLECGLVMTFAKGYLLSSIAARTVEHQIEVHGPEVDQTP